MFCPVVKTKLFTRITEERIVVHRFFFLSQSSPISTHKYIFKKNRGYLGTKFIRFPLWKRWGIGSKTKHSCDSSMCAVAHPCAFLPLSSFTSNPTAPPAASRLTPNFLPGWILRAAGSQWSTLSLHPLDALTLTFHPHLNKPNAHPGPNRSFRSGSDLWETLLHFPNTHFLSQAPVPPAHSRPPSAWESHWDASSHLMQVSIFNMRARPWRKRQL